VALAIIFDGLLVDMADWLDLLREQQAGSYQVDEAPGLCARAYCGTVRIADPHSM
jgi:hypothetical protein